MMKEFFYSKRNKISLIGIGVFAIYSFITLFRGLPLQWLDMTEISETGALIYSLLVSIIIVGIISYIYADKLRNNFDDLKKNHKHYFEKHLKYWLFALLFMALFNLLILTFMPNDLPMNEEVVRDFFGSNPIIVFLSAVLIAPILEELVFRQGFRDMFSDDAVFIFMSSLTFGAFHVVGTATSFIDLVYIIPYAIPAIAFGLMLKETDNVLVPIGFHFLHNGFLIALQFVFLIFG
ncbi:MAG: CPBP family intramembrane metalloprotease [Bacilli bacterium]|nr:CPBP family intramembrane metalloprotease [Bacilli bacterium]MDD4282872.1 CPBP family intramembrane metalloprotease [Bacilli bacterium]MDD4718304.1 CPBP family intramembrane metalloprotease [Bacilli bacterium]